MSSVSSVGDGVTMGNLDSFFTSLIQSVMQVETKPLTDLQTKQDQISVKQGAYSDVSSQLNDFQSATWALQSTSTTSLTLGSKSTVSGAPSGSTVLTASAASSAIAGVYNISLSGSSAGLAAEHRVRSNQQTYADQGLGLLGTFVVGGAAVRSHTGDATKASTVTAFGVSALATGQTELGTSNYKVETRQDPNNSAWYQFRLVDADGNAVNIQQGTSGNYSSDWQAIPTNGGAYDTGRGLSMTFAASGYTATSGSSAANTSYTAQGVSINVASTDSLNAIAANINKATYASGNEVMASVIDRQLVLSAQSTGAAHAVHASDASGTVLKTLGMLGATPDSFANVMQAARDATFTVNGLTVTRSSNTNLTNVISGVTLNLAPDAMGKDATLTVSPDSSSARAAIDTFVTKFNSLTGYLADHTAITSQTNGSVTTYTRGTLNGDSAFGGLRQSLFGSIMNTTANGGSLTNLSQIGLTLNDSLQLTVTDSDKLNTALTTNLDNTKKLLGAVTNQIDTLVGGFTGKTNGKSAVASGYLTALQSSLDSESSYIGNSITQLTATLTKREQSLVDQYGQMQSDLYLLQYQQQQWQTIQNAGG